VGLIFHKLHITENTLLASQTIFHMYKMYLKGTP